MVYSDYSFDDIISISGTITSPEQVSTAVLQVYYPFNVLVQIGTIIDSVFARPAFGF